MSDTPKNPYVGARTFETKESQLFFGREREALNLLSLVISDRLVLFYAQSGAGKSSLINTKLIPGLIEENEFKILPVGRLRRDEVAGGETSVRNIYIYNLITSLTKRSIDESLLSKMSLSEYLAELAVDEKKDDQVFWKYVLIIDQFEELFTTHEEDWEKREDFFKQVAEAMEKIPGLWLVLVMREDYIAYLDPYAYLLPDRLRTRYYMQRLDKERAVEAVEGPAGVGEPKRYYTPGVARQLVKELSNIMVRKPDNTWVPQEGQYVEPVQLQVVCSNLWEKLPPHIIEITQKELDEHVGEINKALGNFYEERVRAIANGRKAKEKGVRERDIRRWFEEELIIDRKRRNMVAQEPGGKSGGLDDEVIGEFIGGLVREEKRGGGATFYELTHDRMVEPIIENNENWFDKNLSPLQRQAALWNNQKRNDRWLLTDEALLEVEQWAKNHTDEITDIEQEFLEACRAKQAEKIRTAHEQSARRQSFVLIGVTAALVISIVLGASAWIARNDATASQRVALTSEAKAIQRKNDAATAQANANRDANLARAGQLAAQSQVVLDKDPGLSLLLSIESLKLAQQEGQSYFPVAETVLQRAIEKVGNGLPLTGHTAPARTIAFSPNGHWLASGSEDSTVRLWNVTSGDPSSNPTTLKGPPVRINFLAFSRDGHWLAAGGGGNYVWLWDMTNLTAQPVILSGDISSSSSIVVLAFSPDGHWLAGGSSSDSGIIQVWDMTVKIPGFNPTILNGPSGAINALVFSRDGHWLAAGGQSTTVWLWHMTDQSPTQISLSGHTDIILALAFSPDGHWLASGGRDSTLRVWDLTAEDPRSNPTILSGPSAQINILTFSQDGHWLVAGSGDHNVWLWDMTNLTAQPTVLSGHNGAILALAFSPDGLRLASGADDYTVGLWDLSSSDRSSSFSLLGTHNGAVFAVAFSPNGKLLASAGNDSTPRLWDVSPQTQENVEEKVSSFEALTSLKGHLKNIESLVFSPDENWLASSSADATVRLWNFQTGIPEKANLVLESKYGPVHTLIFPDSKSLGGGADNSAFIVWDLNAEVPSEQEITLVGHEGSISTMAFPLNSGGVAIPNNNDYSVELWSDVNQHLDLKGHQGIVHALAYSPDERWLASGSADSHIILWNMEELSNPSAVDANKIPSITLTGHDGGVYAVAFSPDGNWLASAGADSTVRLWDFRNDVPKQASLILRGHQGPVYALAFSPNSRWLASAGEDGSVRLWDLSLSDPAAESTPPLNAQIGPIHTLTFSPNARWLVAGGNNPEIQIWGVGSASLIKQACQISGRNLTWQETQEYVENYFADVYHHKTCPDLPIHPSVAANLRDQGDQLAHNSDVDEAIAKYQKARDIDPLVNLAVNPSSSNDIGNPESRAKSLAAQALVQNGDVLAQSGKVKEAVAKYQKARDIDPLVNLAVNPSSSNDIGDPEARAKNLASQALIQNGDVLARSGKVEEAIAEYQKARDIDPSVNLAVNPSSSNDIGSPESRVKDFAVQPLIDAGDELARSGDIEGAIAKYREALAMDPSRSSDLGNPESKAKGFAWQASRDQMVNLVLQGKIAEALSELSKVKKENPDVIKTADANFWNELCWGGSLWGDASDVKDICETAVKLAPQDGNIRDSRGLNRALLGKFEGAILDFQFYVDVQIKGGNEGSDKVLQRQEWISILKTGKNPFTPGVLESLK